jgi:uncharacterized Fe-S cluster-containing MiaB family protein
VKKKKKIVDDIEELKNMFTEDAIEGYTDNDLAWILFVDGCSLLHFMKCIDDQYVHVAHTYVSMRACACACVY